MKSKICQIAGLLLMCVLLSSCKIDYSENAVERARAFALRNLRGISESQRHFIEYTQPAIYENLIFPRYVIPITDINHVKSDDVRSYPTAPEQDLMHSCVVWSPPDLGAKIVVVGDGERSMRLWRPNRVLVKNFLPIDTEYLSAVEKARLYVKNGMLYLTAKDQNHIRFAEPDVVYTRLDVAHDETKIKKQSSWESYLADMKEPPKPPTQISLVWKLSEQDKVIAVTGFSEFGSLKGWNVKTGEMMTFQKLTSASLSAEETARIPKVETPKKILYPKQKRVERNLDLKNKLYQNSTETPGIILNSEK